MASKNNKNTRQLLDLAPMDFEHLIYDLIILRGFVNVIWRTPGADGGRDIEAESVQIDLSGTQTVRKWYIECKRYTASVDWPTIHPKLAYAEAIDADYLLICATSKFTPQAISTTASWNSRRRTPSIRLWPDHEIENQLRLHPDLLLKYGLGGDLTAPGQSIVTLSLALSKAVGTLYATYAIHGNSSDRMIRAANSLAFLLQHRVQELSLHKAILPQPAIGVLDVSAAVVGLPNSIDEPALVAFVNYLAALAKKQLNIRFSGRDLCTIDSTNEIAEILHRYREVFSSIVLWGNLDFTFDSKSITLRQRHDQ